MLLFNTRDELVRVSLRHVIYFEADGNYTQIFFKNGQKVTILYSLAKLEALLDETLRGKKQPFIRIGKRDAESIGNASAQRGLSAVLDAANDQRTHFTSPSPGGRSGCRHLHR